MTENKELNPSAQKYCEDYPDHYIVSTEEYVATRTDTTIWTLKAFGYLVQKKADNSIVGILSKLENYERLCTIDESTLQTLAQWRENPFCLAKTPF